MIAGITASARRGGAALLAPTDLVATLVEPPPPSLPTDIGEEFGGGFYAGDIQYPDGQWYKLIVADKAADITGADSRWKTVNTNTAGTTSVDDGVANTLAMITAGAAQHPAAAHCTNYRAGGNSDWYMPSRNELNVLHLTLGLNRPNRPPAFMDGGAQAFTDWYYWSSTQDSTDSGWMRYLGDGSEGSGAKNTTDYQVRPIRRIPFTPD